MGITYLDLLYKEYVSIVDSIIKNESYLKKTKTNMLIEKQVIDQYLDRYPFLSPTEKLKNWKALSLIRTERDRCTWQYNDPKTKERRRGINIDLDAYKLLKSYSPRSLTAQNIPRKLYNKILRGNSKVKYDLMKYKLRK